MSGSGFRGRGFGSRGIRPRGPSGVRGGPRFPRPPFNRPPFPRHGSEIWHEPPTQPFFAPWQYNGRGNFPKFQVRPPFRHDVPFHRGRGRGPNVRGMPPRMRMPGAPGLYRPELQSKNEAYASPSHNEQHESSANLPQMSPAPPLGSEEERQQKITEAADKLKQKLSSINNQEVENFWGEDVDLIPSKSLKEAPNKEVAELHPHDFSLTSHDLKDIGRVDLHRTPMQDNSVVVLDEVCNRNSMEVSLLDEEIRNSEGESEYNIPKNEVEEVVDNVQENAIDKDITNVPTIDSTVVKSQENTTLQTHQDTTLNFAKEIPHHNPSVSFNCRPEFHRGNVNTPPRFIPRQMGPRFRMPYPQEMPPMGPGKPGTLRPMHPNSRPPNQLDMPRVMFNPHTPPPAVFNRLPPLSNFHSMDQNLNIDTLPQMQADSMHSGVRFDHRGPPPHLSSPSNIQCTSSNEERMDFPGFDPRKPPPSVNTQEEVLQPPPAFDPRLSFQERQRLIPTVASPQLHPPLSMQVPPSTRLPPPPLSGPPPPPEPPGSLLEMVPMTDFDLIPNYSMTNNFDMAQSHFLQLDGVQPLPQQENFELEQNYIDIEGELFMEPPPEPPILSDYCSPPLPETLPPADAPLPPADAPLPPGDVPLPPVDAPLPPVDAPLPPADILLLSTEVPLSQTEVPLSISESPSVLVSKKQGSKTSTDFSNQQEPPRVSKETILASTSQPKTDMDKPKQKRLRMKKSKRENIATCSAPTLSMSPSDKVYTVQNQDNSKQYRNAIQEEVPLSEEQSRPKVVFNLNAKIKKISKQEEWQQQADTSTAKHRKLKTQTVALESPTNALRVQSHSQIRKMPSPKSSKSLISSHKRSEGRGRVSESSWKSTVIERFLKMSKNEIRNILNNSGLRKFDIAMKQLVKERRSSLSLEMRNTEDEKIKSYDREQFICQLNEMLDPSATIDITNLPTEFIRHLGEVLQLNSLPQDQTDSIQNTEAEVIPVHTTSKSELAESTYHKRHGKAISRSLIKREIDISMDANKVHEDTTINNVQINVEQSRETRDSRLNMDLDDIFLAGIARAKHSTKSAAPEKAVTDFDLFSGPSGGGASQFPMVTEPVPETEKFQEEMTFVESRIDKCERWHRKARDDPDMFRNLTKEEWEAKYGKSNNDHEISKPPSRLGSNESFSNKEDISIDSIKSLSIKNIIDRNPRVDHSTTVPVNKYVLNVAKSSSLRHEYQSNKGRSSSDSNSMAVAEVIESISPIEMSGTTWRERSSETCQTIGKSLRETKSEEDSNSRTSTSETRRDKLFTKIGSKRKHREGMSSSRKSRRRERKRKTRKEKERRKRKRRVVPRESSSSYSDSESDSITLFTEHEIKKEIIIKDEPGLENVESSVEKTISHPEPTECNNQSAQQELTIDKTLLSNETIVTNQEPVTNKELITSQELSTTRECTSNKDTSLQMQEQSKPTVLEMSTVSNKVIMEFLEKESENLKTIDDGNNDNSQELDTITITKPLESTSETSHSAKLDVQNEKHTASTSQSVMNKVLDQSKQEKNDITSVTVLTKDVINIPQKSDKHPKDTVPVDAENVRSSSIDELSVQKSGGEAVDKVDIGNETIRSKSNEGRPSTKFQNIKSEGRKEMKLIEEKAKKRSSSLLRDKKSGATKHSKMLTTELKSQKIKIQKEKVSSGTADSSEHKKQMIEVQIPTEDNPDLKDPRLSKLKECVQQSPNKSAKNCHSSIFSEKFTVDSTTEEQAKPETQHSQSTLTSHGNIKKTLRDIERNIRTPLTVEACTVDFNIKAAENTSPEVKSPRSLDSPFKGFSEESQFPSEQLAKSTLLHWQAEFLNGATVSDESIREEPSKNSALCIKTTSPNEDSSLQSQETTSPEVLPEKREEPQSKDVTNLLVISVTGDISDIKKDESFEVQVSSDSLNEKAKSDKLIIDKETHVQGMCIDTGTRINENIEQDRVYENIIDNVKSPVEKLQDVDTLQEEHLEKETSEIVEKLEPAKIFDPIITLEQENIKGLEVAEVGKVEKSSAVVKLPELAETSKVETVAVVAKKYELIKIDTTVKPIVVTKEQEVEKSDVAENLQEAPKVHELVKATEPLEVLGVIKSSSMGKSHEKVSSHEAMKIHEGDKLSVAKKTQERHKPHEMVKKFDTEKLRVAEKTQEITKTHGSKRLETVKISKAVKSSMVRKTRDRYKVREIAKVDEIKQSTAVEKTQEFSKLHDMKKELEVVKPSTVPKRHDITKSPEVVKYSVDLVETSGVEKKSEVIESSIALKRHDIEKLSEVEKLTEVSKSPIILKEQEVVNSPDVQKIPEVERAHEVIKPPVVLKRHDFLKSHEVVKSCEVEEMAEVEKASVLLKRYDPEKIPEIVKPSVLLRRLDVKSPMTTKMQEEVKPFVAGKSHEQVNSPVVEKAQEVVKPLTTLKRHEEVKSLVAEKTQEVIKPSITLKRHEEVKSPVVEKTQEVIKPSATLKRHEAVKAPIAEKEHELVQPSTTSKSHEEVKSPVVEKTQEVIKPSTTSKRHKVVKSPAVETGQEVVTPSTTLKRHEVVKSPIAEKEHELVQPYTTSKRHEEVKSPVVEKTQEVFKPSTTLKRNKVVKSPVVEKGHEAVTPSTTLKRHEVVKSPIAEKEHELIQPSTISKRHEEVKSHVVEKTQEVIKPSTTSKRHKVVKSPAVETGQEVVTPSTTLKRHEVVKSPIAEKEHELVQPYTTSKRHEEVKSPVVEKTQEVFKPSTTLKRHKVVKSPVVEKGHEEVTPSTTLKRHEVVKSPIAEKEHELVQPSTTSKRHEEVKSPVVEKTQEVIKPSTTLKRHKVVKSTAVEKGQEAVTPSTTLKTLEVVKSPIAEKDQEVAKPSATSKRYEEVKSPVVEKLQEVIKPSTTLKRHKVVKSPVVEKGQEAVTPSTTLKTLEVVMSPAEKDQELLKPSTTSKRLEEVKSPVLEKLQEVIKPSTTLKRHKVVKSLAVEKGQETITPSTTLKRHEVVKSPIAEKEQELVKPSTTSKRHEEVKSPKVEKIQEVIKPSKTLKRLKEVKSPIVGKTEEVINSSTTLERHEVVNLPVAEKIQEVVKPSEAFKSYESPEMENISGVIKIQQQVKTDEITKTKEVAKLFVEHMKAHEVSELREPSAGTSKSINTEVTQTEAEMNVTKSQDPLNHHHEKSQETSPETGVSHPSGTKGQYVESSESSKCEEKITKRRRVSRWQDNDDIPKVIEPIQYEEQPKIRSKARKESKKHDDDPLHKIRSKQKFKAKKSKAPTKLDKILSRENAMTKESVMSRMIEIDLEIHKLMTEKMTLYQQLNSESSLLDDNQANTKDNHESRSKKRKEASAEKLTPSRLSSHNKLSLEKGHPPSHQNTRGARNKAILFDDSQADHDSSRKDTLVHVVDSSYEKRQKQTSTSISEAKEGRSVDYVNIEIDKSSFPPENNKEKKRLRLDKPDIEKTHNKSTSSKESLNALKNYKKMIGKPDRKTDDDIATVREVSVESKSCTSPKYPKDNDNSTNVEENVPEDQHVTRTTEDRLQPPVGVDEEGKSSENVSKISDSKTTERLSIYSDDSTRESSLTLESSEAKKCTTGLALLEETFKREMAISRKLKAAARKQKKEEIETLLKNVNSLTADEEEIPLDVLFEMKQKQKQHLLEEMGVKSKLEKLPEKSEENSSTIWKHAMDVINAVAENRTESMTVETHELEIPNLGQLVELSTEQTLLEVETTVKPSDTDKIDNTGTLETMTLISKNILEPAVSVEIASPTSKAAELNTLNESRHKDIIVRTENTPASTENTEQDLIGKDSKKEKSDIQSDTLSENEVKELSAKVAIDDTTDSVKNNHDQIIGNENKMLTGGEDERNIHEIGKTTEAEKEEDPSAVLNKKSADNVECPETLIDSEDNLINENLTSNVDNTVISAETENEAADTTILDVQKDEVIVSLEKESATEMKEVDPTIKSKDLNTSLKLEPLKEIHKAVKETMDDLVNSVPESSSAETISRGNKDCSQTKEEEKPVESEEINSEAEFLGFSVSNQTSVAPTEKSLQPSSTTSEEIETTAIKRNRGRTKQRLSTNSSLSGTMSPVPSTSIIPEKHPKNVQSRGKRKSIVLEPRIVTKRRKTRWSNRSSVELPGVAKEVDSRETSIDAELLSSKRIFVEDSKKRKCINQLQLKNCKVRLIDCESTYLRPDCDPSLLHQYGISKINAYGRTICIQGEPSLKIESNKRSASFTSVQEVITPGYDIVHVESDKEKDSSSFCSWDQNIQELSEPIDVSQDSISQEKITRSRKNYNNETIENCEDTSDNEHVYLSHLDPTVLRQDEVSSPQPVIDINEDENAANTSSQSDIEILEATKESGSLNQVEDTKGEKLLTTVVLEEEKSPRTEYTVHKGPVLDIKVYGDSFMAASEDGTIYRYSQVSNGILNIYRGHKAAVTCLCIPKINFSGISRQWLFSGSLDGTLRCYEIDSGQQVRESVDIGSPIQCMDHAWGVIFLGTKSGHVSRFHIKSGVMKGDNIQFSEVSVLALKATSEGPRRVLIVASRNQPITIRDAQNGLFLRTVSGHKNHTVYSLMMDHHMVYCGTSGTLIPVFDFITAEQVAQYNAGVGIVCMRLYKKLLFAGCYDGNIYVFNTKDRKLVCSIPGPGNMLLSMEVVDNKIIAGSKDRGLHIWLMPKAARALINNRSRNARMKEI